MERIHRIIHFVQLVLFYLSFYISTFMHAPSIKAIIAKNRYTTVGTVTAYELEGTGSFSGRNKKCLSILQSPDKFCSPHRLLSNSKQGISHKGKATWAWYLRLVPRWSKVYLLSYTRLYNVVSPQQNRRTWPLLQPHNQRRLNRNWPADLREG
jgi:hypothetical protein